MADKFRKNFDSGVALLASDHKGRPIVIAAVTEDLVKRGLHAGKLVQNAAKILGGGGGGRPTLAQAGGRDTSKLSEALDSARLYIRENLK